MKGQEMAPVYGRIISNYPNPAEFLEEVKNQAITTFLKDGFHVGIFLYIGLSPGAIPIYLKDGFHVLQGGLSPSNDDKVFLIFPVDRITFDEDKEVFGRQRAKLIRKLAARCAIGAFICEGWTRTYDKSEIPPGTPEEEIPVPTDFPIEERGEALVITFYINNGHEQFVSQIPITRNEDGNPSFGEWESTNLRGKRHGRLIVSDEDRAQARTEQKIRRSYLN